MKVHLQINGKASQDVLIVYTYVCVTSVSGKLKTFKAMTFVATFPPLYYCFCTLLFSLVQ